eukprot:TRINITY_DN11906_c0_g2_i16.p1 TRINITY_DN11906_c0_g2~~TRINITY_DN11906_c0_g2_i16.p1  ORF type:complete len:411 (+),score=39.66 TRINITY_DN11906_c0_g2_i16:718-1950(+)
MSTSRCTCAGLYRTFCSTLVCENLQVGLLEAFFGLDNAEAFVNAFTGSYSRLSQSMQAYTPLHLALDQGYWLNEEIQNIVVRMLLEHGADPNLTCDGRPSLHLTSHSYEIMASLLEFDADPNATDSRGVAPLASGIWEWYEDISPVLELLIEAGADVNFGNGAALREAIKYHEMPHKATCTLVKAGNTTAAVDERGNTALHLACQQLAYQPDGVPVEESVYLTIECMLQHGYDVNARNLAPLHVVCYSGSVEAVELLLRHGADCNIISNDGMSPLLRARMRNQAQEAKILQDHGARLQFQHVAGCRALLASCLAWKACRYIGLIPKSTQEQMLRLPTLNGCWSIRFGSKRKYGARNTFTIDHIGRPCLCLLAWMHACTDQHMTADRIWDVCVKWSNIAIRDDESRSARMI